MASSSDVVKKIMRFKLQLSDAAEPATVDTVEVFVQVFAESPVCLVLCEVRSLLF